MSARKLKNAPLKEAIFEIFWDSPIDQNGMKIDKEFEISLGKFAHHASSFFPIHKRTIPQGAPIKFYGLPIHQFWRGHVLWPVIQIGPGVLTVNDTDKNYHWEETYRPTIKNAIEILGKSYSNLPNFNKFSLKYIDSVDLKAEEDLLSYLKINLLTNIENQYQIPGNLSALNINQVFDVNQYKVSINIQTAVNNVTGAPAIVWITSVVKVGNITEKDLLLDIDSAHTLCSNLFINMLNKEFYAAFDK